MSIVCSIFALDVSALLADLCSVYLVYTLTV